MSALRKSINKAGGVANAAAICGVSQRAVYKWISAGALPRTDYTGETDYAGRLAKAAAERGVPFDAAWLLAEAAPKKTAA
ncbi:helix-turn-helix domain-containing protein [Azotobacter chroococcum]|uniref:hypothetical protein n=1 Tax=Azotobacter chroococcum TaxID=353 RepID=UPI000B796BDC|nr:hypothetical protein [Azotobacter chroococcum]TBW07885.1 hypothetical protein E0E52_10540 [Azotobacter chroococcum]